MKNTSQNTSQKNNGVLDTYLQETLSGQETLLQKTHKKRGKNRGNLGMNQAQKTPQPSYEAEKITVRNEKIYIHHIDKR